MHGAILANTARGEEEVVVTKEIIFTCCDRGDVATLRLWASQGVDVFLGGDLITKAITSGKIAVVRFLIEELGANVNRIDSDGLAPLHHATVNAHLDVIRMLVNEFGANVDQAMRDGSTPMFITAERIHLIVLRCLGQELSADINKTNIFDATPFSVATKCDALPGPGAGCKRQPSSRCWSYTTDNVSSGGNAEHRAFPGQGAWRRR
jgi:hypothetical protein